MDSTNHRLSLGGPRLGGWGSDVERVPLSFWVVVLFSIVCILVSEFDYRWRHPFPFFLRVRWIFLRSQRERDKLFEYTL